MIVAGSAHQELERGASKAPLPFSCGADENDRHRSVCSLGYSLHKLERR